MSRQLPFDHLCILASLMCLTLVSACVSKDHDSAAPAPVVSSQPKTALPMPPLNSKSVGQMGWEIADGQRSVVGDYKGKVLVLDFYATWCNPCRLSIPDLVTLQRRHNEAGLRVVGLNVGGPGDLERVPEFARELKIQYPLAIPDADLSEMLLGNDEAIPQTFVFDRNGQLVKRFIGAPTTREIDTVVEAALQSQSY